MADADRELTELRREIVEARNQAIKTDNQVKNLSLDVKAFEKRFDVLERRTRLASLGAHVLIAVTIIAAAYIVHTIRVRNLTQDLDRSLAAAEESRQAAEQAEASAKAKAASLDQERAKRERSAAVALKLVDLLDKGREKESIDLLDSIDMASLTPLESKMLDRRVGELRAQAAEAAYKAGRNAQAASRWDTAISEFRKSIAVEPDGKVSSAARYYLATQLWTLKRHQDAEPVIREVLKKDNDKTVLEEMRYLLPVSLAALGRRDEAKAAFAEVAQRGGKYGSHAREQIAAIDAAVKAEAAAAAQAAAAQVPAPAAPAVAKKPDAQPAQQTANAKP